MAGVGENENEREAAATAFQLFQHKRGEARASALVEGSRDVIERDVSLSRSCLVSMGTGAQFELRFVSMGTGAQFALVPAVVGSVVSYSLVDIRPIRYPP